METHDSQRTRDADIVIVGGGAGGLELAVRLAKAGHKDPITTEVAPLDTIYFAEDYHQQYLAKNPGGYCGIGGTGVTCPIGAGV